MNKTLSIIFILILLFNTSTAQRYLLLDRRWYAPAIISDTVIRNDLSEGKFPVFKTEFDSLIALVNKLKNLKDDGMNRRFFYSEDFKTSHLEFQIENIKRAYGDGYEINLISKGDFGSTTIKLSDPKLNLIQNQKSIRSFLTYLNKTKSDLDKLPNDKKNNTKNNPLID